ncbi:MAG TPA: hypothetical protein VMX75_10600 [Spirochaetia bacterium]|nr:hypothetical protein [Spirochaetia bacterium]
MYRLAILYAPYSEEYIRLIEELSGAFGELGLDVAIRGAKDAGVPDILAADIVVFGSDHRDSQSGVSETKASPAGKLNLHPDFGEMERAFEGINLAGKFAGFISMDGGPGPGLFKKALQYTEISTFADDLVFNRKGLTSEQIHTWAKALYKKFEEGMYERESSP